MGLAETANLAVALAYKDGLTPGLQKTQGALRRFDSTVGKVGAGVGKTAAGIARAGTIIAGAAATGFVASAKLGADFEAQLNTINTIARATPPQLEKIGQGIRNIAKATGGDLADLTSGFYDILSAGITDAADAQNVLTEANKLAIGGLSTTAEAVDVLTSAINSYQQDASEAGHDTDLFAKAVERGKATVSDIAQGFSNIAPLAAKFHIGLDEVAAGYARITSTGATAGEASTQMSSAITALIKPTKTLKALQAETGKSYIAIAGKKGLAVAFEQLQKDAKAAGIPLTELVGRKEALLYVLNTTGDAAQAYAADLAAMQEAEGTAAGQMAERQKGLTFQFARLKANLKDAALTLSAGFLPAMSRSIEKLTTFLAKTENQTALKTLGEDIGKAIDGIDWDGVLKGTRDFVSVLKIAFDYAKRMFDVINMLPGEIKAAGAGFLALNKLSGGLIAGGLSDIVGALVKGLGSQIPGVGKLLAQPVFVTNWPAGGIGGVPGTGGAGSLPSIMSLLPIAGIVAAASQAYTDYANDQAHNAGIKGSVDNPFAGGIFGGLTVLPSMLGVMQELLDVTRNPPTTPVHVDNAPKNRTGGPDDRGKPPVKPPPGSVGHGTTPPGRREYNRSQTTLAKNVTDVRDRIESAKIAASSAARNLQTATNSVGREARDAGARTTSATDRQGGNIVAAIHGIPAPVTNVHVNVTGSTVTKTQTQNKRNSGGGSSRNRDRATPA